MKLLFFGLATFISMSSLASGLSIIELGSADYYSANRCMTKLQIVNGLRSEEALINAYCDSNGVMVSRAAIDLKRIDRVIKFSGLKYSSLDACAKDLQGVELLGNNKSAVAVNAFCGRDGLMNVRIILE
ncbi:MAG: hypothetical protein HON90_13535 [Halobacteriovoraceae bacterium]|jgi:hypothetical protein|nr:hypothetical protein [Halobacteriovoraceae bacterium]